MICDQPFASRPYVHLPADKNAASSVTLYLAHDITTGTFHTRDGSTFYVMDTHGKIAPIGGFGGSYGANLPSSFHAPSNRNMYLIYQVTGKTGKAKDPDTGDQVAAIQVTGGKPVVMLPGKVIDGSALGVWEGTIQERGESGMASSDLAPLRIRFSALAANTTPPGAPTLNVWDSGTSLADGQTFSITGTIENYTQNIKGSDGKCYRALTALGTANPFYGAPKGDISLFRLAGMHHAGDQVVVLWIPDGATNWSQTGMDILLGPFAPADLISTKDRATLAIHPHGLEGGEIDLHATSGGGGSCP